ncbi:MAG: DUF3857 and transglutaminase domain-containing protein [Acidobacteria bacterium]|nr:DUF3857 and transglutaminase domain-containing protein [Acidobacteriota bacterium]
MKKIIPRPHQRIFPILIIGLLFALSSVFAQTQWRPVSQAELDQKTPQVEPDADAEAIFWEVRLDDKKGGKMFYNHYVRVKIFTERGRERFSKFDIPIVKDKKVEEVAARVIKPDGTTVELQPGDIFERDIFRSGKLTIRAKSFAVPGIAPGVIVEYQYKETYKGDSAENERLYFQRDIPMQKVVFYVRPNPKKTLNFDYQNMPRVVFQPSDDGFYVGMRENVPALREEPQMPPEDEVRQWALLSYRSEYSFRWGMLGEYLSEVFDQQMAPDPEIQQKARELTAGANTDEEKLRNIYNFVQRQIRNANYDRTVTDEQLENLKNKKPADTLRRRMGSFIDLNILFAALARAAGYTADAMYSGDRSEHFFNYQEDLSPRYIHPSGVAVRVDGAWKPFDPGTPFMPFGMTYWHDEVVSTMITGSGSYRWINLPMAGYKVNLSKRAGKFRLLEDGTLEGLIRVEHNGQQAIMRRMDMYRRTPAEREEMLKKSWMGTVPTAEISDFSMENFDDPEQPYTYSFKVRVPNYAQKTGKRLFLQPGFFEYGSNPLFSSETRKYSIYFEYPWSENDEIEIELPKNYEADSIDPPGPVFESKNLGALNIKISLNRETNTLKYSRQFFFGNDSSVLFPAGSYKPLKTLFDAFHKADTQTISLKQKQ